MNKYFYLIPALILSGCVSPAANMTPEQVATFSNQQLCELTWNYPYEQKTQLEIGRRGLNCDPVYIECDNSGLEPGTPAFTLCMNNIRQRNALAQQVQIQQTQLQLQAQQQQPSATSQVLDQLQDIRERQQQQQIQLERERAINDRIRGRW
jgi:hypothetical protein